MTEHSYSSSSQVLSNLRRQPKQQRGKERVEKILVAAAAVFDEVGYEAATTHLIAARAETAIGSLYQFFPDKAAIFKAMELLHTERVEALWAYMSQLAAMQLPLRQMIQAFVAAVADLFAKPISRVVFVQFYLAREIFQTIDESMTQNSIKFMTALLKQRNSTLADEDCSLLAEVCIHSGNAIMLAALRRSDLQERQRLIGQIEMLLISYLESHIGDLRSGDVMKVMICPHCHSQRISKNGHRRGKQCYLCKDCKKQFVESAACCC